MGFLKRRVVGHQRPRWVGGSVAALGLVLASIGLWGRAQQHTTFTAHPSQPELHFLSVFFRGHQIGVISTRRAVTGGGVRVQREARLFLQNSSERHQVISREDVRRGPGGSTPEVAFEIRAEGTRFKGAGGVRGHLLQLEIEAGGEVGSERLDVEGALTTTAGVPLDLTRWPGRNLQRFDPLKRALTPLRAEGPHGVFVASPEGFLRARRWILSTPTRTWALDLDESGRRLHEDLGGGVHARRASPLMARWGLRAARAGRGVDVMRATSIPIDPPLPDLRRVRTLKLRLSGVDLRGFDLEDHRQAWSEGILTIQREPRWGTLKGPPPTRALAATRLIQHDDPQIIALSRRLVGDATDQRAAARRLAAWIELHVAQAHVSGAPSALEVLRTRRGDCNERAILFAALARAAGIPTGVVLGLVYREGSFGYHAWNEIWVEGRVSSVDVAWGQTPVDVGHIKLLSDGLRRQEKLAALWGRLSIEVLEIQ